MELGRDETKNSYIISVVKRHTKQTSRTGRGHEGPAPAATAARWRNRLPAPLCHCAVRTGGRLWAPAIPARPCPSSEEDLGAASTEIAAMLSFMQQLAASSYITQRQCGRNKVIS